MPASRPLLTVSRRGALLLGAASGLLALGEGAPTGAADAALSEANKALVRQVFQDIINGGRMEALGELYAPEFADRDAYVREAPRPVGLPLPLASFRAAFPAVEASVDIAVAEGDLVAALAMWRDIHPPLSRHAIGRTMHLFRIANGQITEQWSAGWEWLVPLIANQGPGAANPLMGD